MRHSQRSTTALTIRVAVAALLAAAAAAPAAAQTAKEAELEARIAELERLVRQLSVEKPAAPATGAAPATAAAAPPAKPAAKPIQPDAITPNASPGTSFIFTGFAKTDGLWTDTPDGELVEGSASRDFYVPGAIPIGGVDEGVDFDAHAKQTRLILGTDTVLEGGDKIQTRFEIDFFGSASGNQRVSNTYSPVLRHAFVQWRTWLVGQTWSNFQDVATLPEAVDFIGPTDGTVFVRQPQVRYTKGGLTLSAENPETTLALYRSATAANISSDDSSFPDLTARYTWKGQWGHFSVAGLARELKYEGTSATVAYDDSQWTGALSLSGKFMIGKDDIRWMANYGNLGRYVALNFSQDAVLDGRGGLDSIDGYSGFIAYRHLWTDRLRSSVYYALQGYDNDSGLTGTAVNESSNSWTVNLIYSPLPKLDIGGEYRHASRELESGADGSLDRVQIMTKYSF